MRVDYNDTPIPTTCPHCGQDLVPEVLVSGGGYFIGSKCGCGIYCRDSRPDAFPFGDQNDQGHETGYYRTWERAEEVLAEYYEYLFMEEMASLSNN
jgi:hypothetical protein